MRKIKDVFEVCPNFTEKLFLKFYKIRGIGLKKRCFSFKGQIYISN